MSHARRHMYQALIVWAMWELIGVSFFVTAKLHIFPLDASMALKTLGAGMMWLGIPGLGPVGAWGFKGLLLDLLARR
jgi:hypothetical protein